MKAIVCTKYGLDALKLEEIPKPIPNDDEVLVRVLASSLNFASMIRIKGKPFIVRPMIGGFLKPKYNIPGGEIAGQVEAIGRSIKQFKLGDEVYGDTCNCGYGAFAEYVCAPENILALKPTNISFEEAAAVPQSALVALQGLRAGQIQKWKKVLIYGASGGIGTFAVQIAKSYGAEVTGVCSTKNLEMIKALGADKVIDYTKEDFTKNGQYYDLILAIRGYRSIYDYHRALSPMGVYVMVGGSLAQIFQSASLGPQVFKNGSKKIGKFTYTPNQKDFVFMKELIEAGKVKPVVDKCYPLSEVGKALLYYSKGHARGKIFITVEHDKNLKREK
jgi:NADPH:quinone reductase-like Zn-dependent oxidoreductase